jgi:hypothetical protein
MEILEREKRNEAKALAEARALQAAEESRLAAEAEPGRKRTAGKHCTYYIMTFI